MRCLTLLLSVGLVTTSSASPWGPGHHSHSWNPSHTASASPGPSASAPAAYLKGFTNPEVFLSAGGKATRIQGDVAVKASTSANVKLNLAIPANQSVVTEIFVQDLQVNSTYAASISEGPNTVSGTYTINSKICYPTAKGINATTIQFLIHGIGFDKTYWSFRPGYSYVDVAAEYSYTTFSYDRLGVGLSAKPDPIQVVQIPLEIAIAHSLIGSIRAGDFSSTAFKHVVGTGHSFGSEQTQALTLSHPKDLDAAVLTGFAIGGTGIPTFVSALNSAIARENDPQRFAELNNGYLVIDNMIGNQFDFFRLPYYDPALLVASTAAKQTYTLGELLSPAVVNGVATEFTGPVDIINGVHDWPFCQGNCLYPHDLTAATLAALYPAASSGSVSFNVPGAAHGLNFHYEAGQAFTQIQNFVRDNGL